VVGAVTALGQRREVTFQCLEPALKKDVVLGKEPTGGLHPAATAPALRGSIPSILHTHTAISGELARWRG
jgi:hypothetical protein